MITRGPHMRANARSNMMSTTQHQRCQYHKAYSANAIDNPFSLPKPWEVNDPDRLIKVYLSILTLMHAYVAPMAWDHWTSHRRRQDATTTSDVRRPQSSFNITIAPTTSMSTWRDTGCLAYCIYKMGHDEPSSSVPKPAQEYLHLLETVWV